MSAADQNAVSAAKPTIVVSYFQRPPICEMEEPKHVATRASPKHIHRHRGLAGPPERPLVQLTYRMKPNSTGTTVTESWELLEPEPFIDSLGADYPSQPAILIEQDLVTTLTRLKASIESAD